MCRQDTFNALPRWIEETEIHCSGRDQPVVRYIVANKIDEKDIRVVSKETALDFIESIQPVSSKNSSSQNEHDSHLKSKKFQPNPYYEEFKTKPNPGLTTDNDVDTNLASIDGYFEVSAKNTDGVRNMFVSMVEQIIATGCLDPPPIRPASRLGSYSSWAPPAVIDMAQPFTKVAGKCYSSC